MHRIKRGAEWRTSLRPLRCRWRWLGQACMSSSSEQGPHEPDDLLCANQAAAAVARVETVVAAALDVVAARWDHRGLNGIKRTVVKGLRLGMPHSLAVDQLPAVLDGDGVTRQAPDHLEEGLTTQPRVVLLRIACKGEQDVVATVQCWRRRLCPGHPIGHTVRQAGRPVEDNGQARGGIQEQPDIGQRPDGEHGEVEVPAATHVGQLLVTGLPGLAIVAHVPGHGRRDADDLQSHGMPTFWRNRAVRSTVWGVGPATAPLSTTRHEQSRGNSSRAMGRRWAKARTISMAFCRYTSATSTMPMRSAGRTTVRS